MSNTLYRVFRFSESLFTLNNLADLGSYLLMYGLGSFLLSSQVLSKKVQKDFISLLLMASYTFCIYLFSTYIMDTLLHMRNFNIFNFLKGFTITLIVLYIVNVLLKHRNQTSVNVDSDLSTLYRTQTKKLLSTHFV
jgi:hypothetical protein